MQIAVLTLILLLQQVCAKSQNHTDNSNMERNQMNQNEIVERIKEADELLADKITRREATLEKRETPFLKNGTIYRIAEFNPTRPIIHHIVFFNDRKVVILEGDEQSFYSSVREAGLVLDKANERVEYVKAYLEIVYASGKRLQILNDIDEITERPNLTEEKRKIFAEVKEKYRSLVKPPSCSLTNCILFAVKGQSLVKFDLKISGDGEIKVEEEVLEKELLIPYTI
ncbi:MAG: hypothetical protein N2Z23_08245 [Pyrinomonadaceae bacterium]|nr:hypothetical protein [Pyrinomonadaceae bacterium]MCX7640411.1 hypothetical protein [Pyrinomonadaceae bacterium]MDW8304838.1 hypothetical protein [Acidobacteriota bacterium]